VAPFAGTIVNGLPLSVCAARLSSAATGNLLGISAMLPALTRALTPFEQKKKDCKFVLAVLLSASKGITRATNARVRIAQNDPLVHAVSHGDSGVTN
jgi:hypothetical protein